MNTRRRAGAVLVAAALTATFTATPATAADTRKCVTKGEYKSIEVGEWVYGDFDGDGDEDDSKIKGGTTFAKAKQILDGPGTEIGWGMTEPTSNRVWSSCKGDAGIQIIFEGLSFDQPKKKWKVTFKDWVK